MRVFDTIIMAFSSHMNVAWQDRFRGLPHRWSPFVRDDSIRRSLMPFDDAPEKLDCRGPISTRREENIQHFPLVTTSPPEIELLARDFQEHLVHVPSRARSGSKMTQLSRISSSEFRCPATDRFI